jgi:hypothetical protein
MPEELETILRLVAEGTLSPDEAAPIIEALTRAERAAESDGFERVDRVADRARRHAERLARHAGRVERHVARAEARVDEAMGQAHGRQLRIRVTERGRQVVNLRIPIGFVDAALRFVPGLGGDQASRIRDAVRAGVVGPILDVEDPDGQGGVLISVE